MAQTLARKGSGHLALGERGKSRDKPRRLAFFVKLRQVYIRGAFHQACRRIAPSTVEVMETDSCLGVRLSAVAHPMVARQSKNRVTATVKQTPVADWLVPNEASWHL